MLIAITDKHITEGKRQNRLACPIALALRDATGEVWSVTSKDARIDVPRRAAFRGSYFELHPVVRNILALYDKEGKMAPFSFSLITE